MRRQQRDESELEDWQLFELQEQLKSKERRRSKLLALQQELRDLETTTANVISVAGRREKIPFLSTAFEANDELFPEPTSPSHPALMANALHRKDWKINYSIRELRRNTLSHLVRNDIGICGTKGHLHWLE